MARTRKIPQRMCVGCRQMKDKKELIRIVRTPEGSIEIDSTGKRSGRGAYLCSNPECFNQALKKKGLQKALEKEIEESIISEIMERINQLTP
ncbi:MAG: RNase P modulator RnpM [Syntrophomonadaceae bacterium]